MIGGAGALGAAAVSAIIGCSIKCFNHIKQRATQDKNSQGFYDNSKVLAKNAHTKVFTPKPDKFWKHQLNPKRPNVWWYMTGIFLLVALL